MLFRWSEIACAASGQPRVQCDGNDFPAWSRKSECYAGPSVDPRVREGTTMAGRCCGCRAELHAHSNFSFLDGANHPGELLEEAARQGLDAIFPTDHDAWRQLDHEKWTRNVELAISVREMNCRWCFTTRY